MYTIYFCHNCQKDAEKPYHLSLNHLVRYHNQNHILRSLLACTANCRTILDDDTDVRCALRILADDIEARHFWSNSVRQLTLSSLLAENVRNEDDEITNKNSVHTYLTMILSETLTLILTLAGASTLSPILLTLE